MFVAGIDAHATYSVTHVSNTGQLVHEPVRIDNTDEERLHELFEPYRPLDVVETSPAWPSALRDSRATGFTSCSPTSGYGHRRVHYKSDEIDAARMRAGLIPSIRSDRAAQAVLLRNRARGNAPGW